MADLSLVNALKTAFSALGAKTSDNNYAVGLFDKTTAEPKGIMSMSDLASVLGGIKAAGNLYNYNIDNINYNSIWTNTGNPQLPSNSYGFLINLEIAGSYSRAQIHFQNNENIIRWRVCSSSAWSEWRSIRE